MRHVAVETELGAAAAGLAGGRGGVVRGVAAARGEQQRCGREERDEDE